MATTLSNDEIKAYIKKRAEQGCWVWVEMRDSDLRYGQEDPPQALYVTSARKGNYRAEEVILAHDPDGATDLERYSELKILIIQWSGEINAPMAPDWEDSYIKTYEWPDDVRPDKIFRHGALRLLDGVFHDLMELVDEDEFTEKHAPRLWRRAYARAERALRLISMPAEVVADNLQVAPSPKPTLGTIMKDTYEFMTRIRNDDVIDSGHASDLHWAVVVPCKMYMDELKRERRSETTYDEYLKHPDGRSARHSPRMNGTQQSSLRAPAGSSLGVAMRRGQGNPPPREALEYCRDKSSCSCGARPSMTETLPEVGRARPQRTSDLEPWTVNGKRWGSR